MSNRTDIVVETDNAEGQVLLSASRVYDLTEDKTQDIINSELKNTLTQLDGAKAPKSDLASPTNKTTPNNDENQITKGTFFYLNGDLARAKEDIGANAPFTSGTNYELISNGGFNDIGLSLLSRAYIKKIYIPIGGSVNVYIGYPTGCLVFASGQATQRGAWAVVTAEVDASAKEISPLIASDTVQITSIANGFTISNTNNAASCVISVISTSPIN